MLEQTTEAFFRYNANRGGRLLTLYVNSQLTDLKLSEFKKLTCTFTLPCCAKVFKQSNNKIVTVS
jgi:hypothetical protein